MKNHNQKSLEAHMTHKELLEWAVGEYKDTGKWPTKRYRLEGSRAGNSSLQNESDAKKLAYKFGGKVVEAIPKLRRYLESLDYRERKRLRGE